MNENNIPEKFQKLMENDILQTKINKFGNMMFSGYNYVKKIVELISLCEKMNLKFEDISPELAEAYNINPNNPNRSLEKTIAYTLVIKHKKEYNIFEIGTIGNKIYNKKITVQEAKDSNIILNDDIIYNGIPIVGCGVTKDITNRFCGNRGYFNNCIDFMLNGGINTSQKNPNMYMPYMTALVQALIEDAEIGIYVYNNSIPAPRAIYECFEQEMNLCLKETTNKHHFMNMPGNDEHTHTRSNSFIRSRHKLNSNLITDKIYISNEFDNLTDENSESYNDKICYMLEETRRIVKEIYYDQYGGNFPTFNYLKSSCVNVKSSTSTNYTMANGVLVPSVGTGQPQQSTSKKSNKATV